MPGPVGISKHPEKGWALIGSFGQSSVILWRPGSNLPEIPEDLKEQVKSDYEVYGEVFVRFSENGWERWDPRGVVLKYPDYEESEGASTTETS